MGHFSGGISWGGIGSACRAAWSHMDSYRLLLMNILPRQLAWFRD